MKQKLGELLFHMIPVTLGVFIGFWVSNWSEDRKLTQKRTVLLESIKQEMASNREMLGPRLAYHQMLMDSTHYYRDHPDSLARASKFFEGTRLFPLAHSAYDTGTQTGLINEFPIKLLQNLHKVYTIQDHYNKFGRELTSKFITVAFSDTSSTHFEEVRFLSYTLLDVVLQEEALISFYDAFEEAFEEQGYEQ